MTRSWLNNRRTIAGALVVAGAAGAALLAWATEPVSQLFTGRGDEQQESLIPGTPVPGAGRGPSTLPEDYRVTPTPVPPTPAPTATAEQPTREPSPEQPTQVQPTQQSTLEPPTQQPTQVQPTQQPTQEPPTATPEPERFIIGSAEVVAQLTGELAPVFDHSWNIIGADLGFSFKHKGQIYVVFGDTWGRTGGEGTDWRSNTMGIISKHPDQGYAMTDFVKDGNGEAIELLPSMKEPGQEYTVLPTSGISVDGRMYLHYVSITNWHQEDWGYKGMSVNYTSVAYSDDDGHTWTEAEAARHYGDYAFTQTAMVGHDGFVYVYGIPAGRFGPAKLFRTTAEGLLDPATYRYWDGDGWSPEAATAAEVVPAPVGELSVKWSEYHDRWIMMYLNDISHNIVLRTAESLEGPWDEERTVLLAADHPTLYAPMILPDIDSPEIYFIISLFNYYNTFLARTTLVRE